MLSTEIVIDPLFEGPPAIAHGGYTCGLLALRMGGNGEVTLRRPVRLGVPLRLARAGDGGLDLFDGPALVARAGPPGGELPLAGPPPPTFAQALAASSAFPGLVEHPYPRCVVCGPRRTDPDAFRIFPGPVLDGDMVAAVWHPAGTAAAGGQLRREVGWAALDCPGGWAAGILGEVSGALVLGRMAVWLADDLPADDTYMLTGWWGGRAGRKLGAGSALYRRDGTLLGLSRQTWIALDGDGVTA